jgi:hypothetical protein
MILPSRCLATIRGVHIQTHRLMKGIYEVRRWDVLRCHDIYTKFHKYWFKHSKVNGGGDIQTRRQHGYRISLVLIFRSKDIRLKIIFLDMKFYNYVHLF